MIEKIIRKILKYFPDVFYLKVLYFIKVKKILNLKKPETFNEKLQWLKIHDRNPLYIKLVDKNNVKNYVEERIGNEFIIPTIGIYNSFDEIKFDELPNKFVIKTTHDSGGVCIVDNKANMNFRDIKKKINKSLKNNYYYSFREWAYKNVKPQIIIEKFLDFSEDLMDYKIFCFNGEPKFTLVCSNRNGDYKNTNFYDNEWKLLPFTRKKHTNNIKEIKKPVNFELMLNIAKKLSKDIPFVRVDLYNFSGKIYFGELTFFPSSGFEGFDPEEWDKELGKYINLENIRKD